MAMEFIGFLIQQCAAFKSSIRGPSLHALVFKTGLQSHTVTCNHIIKMYTKCDGLATARKVFDEMLERNIVSWSLMVASYTRIRQHFVVAHLFSYCQFPVNEHIYSSVIASCTAQRDMRAGQQLHTRTLKLQLSPSTFVSNTLIALYMECGVCADAVKVFEEMTERSIVTYNTLISGLRRCGDLSIFFDIYSSMRRSDFLPDRFTFYGLLMNCKAMEDQIIGRALHCQTIKSKLFSCDFVGNLIISMYGKWNLIDEVVKSFEDIEEKDVVSWNTFITFCCRCGDQERAFRVFRKMLKERTINPDEFTFSSALSSCSGLASLRFGKEIHSHMLKFRKFSDVTCYNSLINMYAKCGSIEKAYIIFRNMELTNLHTWNTVIGGFANHGDASKAFQIFEEMKMSGFVPDSITFLELLVSCNHAGLPDKGASILQSMQSYHITPTVDHVSCLVDLLGRCGRLEEAEECVKKHPFGENSVVSGSFLSGCRLKGNVGVGERTGRAIIKMGSLSSSPYVLLSNLYAAGEMWDSVSETRKLLKSSGIKKEAGFSIMELKGTSFKFYTGDCFGVNNSDINIVMRCFAWDANLASFQHYLNLL